MDTPDLDQLGRIASTVKRQYWPDGSMPCGITHEDLIAEGWLAYAAAKQFPYARARFAMIDLIRSTMSPVSGRLGDLKDTKAEPLYEELVFESSESYRPPVAAMGLSRGDVNALRTCCHRRLSAKKAQVMIDSLIGGESLDLIADRMKVPRQRVAVMRAQACSEIREIINGGR